MDKITINAYNKFAKEYDEETKEFWEIFPRTFFEKFITLLKSGAKVLDVGCGPGRDAVILKEQGLDILCLDAAQAMLNIAKSKGLPTVLAYLTKKLPFPDDCFDGVWAYASLLHIPKKEISLVINEISRILKPGGILGLGLIEGETEGFKADEQMTRWFSYYQKSEVEDLLTEHKFKMIYFESFKPKTRDYLNFIVQTPK